LLTHEGLFFSNAHWPILTKHLALLGDCEFEFKARIVSRNVGWVVKATRPVRHAPFRALLPDFCIMFNVNQEGKLRPHILNARIRDPSPAEPYYLFDEKPVRLSVSDDGWFSITTRVVGDTVTVFNNGKLLFEHDFTQGEHASWYDFPDKQGEVGFRCHPGEQAVVNYVSVRQLDVGA
jgi:hypothetical protein